MENHVTNIWKHTVDLVFKAVSLVFWFRQEVLVFIFSKKINQKIELLLINKKLK